MAMSDEPENLMLVYLRRLDSKMDRLIADNRELKHRSTTLDVGLASNRREIAIVGESVAHLSVRLDGVEERLERIERRLDLVPA
jgi:hypothetical protein